MESGALIARFVAYQRARGHAPNTIRSYRSTLKGLAELIDPRSLGEATRDDVEAFLSSRNITARGRYHYLSHIGVFYAWALDEDLVEANPARRIPRPRVPESLPRPVGRDDLDAALAIAGPRLRCWLLLGAFAGLRCKEIAGLRGEDILLDREPPVLVVTSPKGRRQRAVPLHRDVLDALRVHGLPTEGWVFRSGDHDIAVQPHTVSHEVGRLFRSVGSPATAHQLRHYFGTAVYSACHDLRLTQELLGHSSPQSTMIYTQLAPGAAAQVIASL